MSLELCRRAKTLASRFDEGPALNPNELGHWWRFRAAVAAGQIECVSVDEVTTTQVIIGRATFRPGAKVTDLLNEIRRQAASALVVGPILV